MMGLRVASLLLAILAFFPSPLRAVAPQASVPSTACLSGDLGACMEADVEEAEEFLAEEMQVGLLQRMPLEMVHAVPVDDGSSAGRAEGA
mmetsp:Transcript_29636/g.84762  ORF Transcript_29636/g.84762 Transcript_29636/m.84762 type:complete len:90 (-) Transcript_29636:140-409(-)